MESASLSLCLNFPICEMSITSPFGREVWQHPEALGRSSDGRHLEKKILSVSERAQRMGEVTAAPWGTVTQLLPALKERASVDVRAHSCVIALSFIRAYAYYIRCTHQVQGQALLPIASEVVESPLFSFFECGLDRPVSGLVQTRLILS